MNKLIFFILLIILILPLLARSEDNIKDQLFTCEGPCDKNFLITSINIKIQNNQESIITINTAKYNESDDIKINIPMILPQNYKFSITKSEVGYKDTELFGANVFNYGEYRGDKLIPVKVPITQFIYYCDGCVKKISNEPFGRYRFLFPFAISKNNIISSGIITDALFTEIPEKYELKGVGKGNSMGGLVKVSGNVNTLPEDLNISEIPENAFGLNLNGNRVTRLRFDSFNHVILFDYGNATTSEAFAIISPIFLLVFCYFSIKKWSKRDYEITLFFIVSLITIRLFFTGILFNLVLWDLEIILIGLIGIVYFFKKEYLYKILHI